MKLIYLPNQKHSILQIESPDDLDYYGKIEKIMSCSVPEKAYTGYCIKQKRAKKAVVWDGKIGFIQESLFLTGLAFMIKKLLVKLEIPHTIQIISSQFNLETNPALYNTLRPVQKDIVEKLERHSKKYNFIRKLIHIPIGAGKSYLIENFSKLFPNTTSILIVESLGLYSQYVEAGVISVKDDGIQSGKVNIMMAKYYEKHYSDISQGLKEIDFLLLDEVHLKAVKSVAEKYSIGYLKKGLLGFTATLPDEPIEKLNLFGSISSSVYIKKYKEVYSYFPTVRIVKNSYRPLLGEGKNYNDLCKTIVKSKRRLELIHKLVKQHPDKKILISVDKIENNLVPLYKYLKAKGVNVKCIHGKMDVKKRTILKKALQRGMINVLIASSVTKAGINLDKVDVLILNSYYVSSIPVIQFVGRLIRKDDPSIEEKLFYDICDSAYKVFLTQMKKRISIYQKLDWKVVMDKKNSC